MPLAKLAGELAGAEDYRALVETIGDAIFHLNPCGELIFVNAAFTAITGWAAGECLGRPFASLLQPENAFAGQSLLQSAFTGEPSPATELLLLSRTGEPVPVEVLLSANQSDGRVVSVVGSGRDIRSRRHLEDQWREVPKLDSLGRLVAGVSHHYNNLLTVQRGYLSLLLQEARGQPRLLKFVQEVIAATDSATKLTRDFLCFGRRKPMNKRPLALGQTLCNLEEVLRKTAGDLVDLEIRVQESLPPVIADRAMIEQVLVHLTANARDAMPAGGHLLLEMQVDAGAPLQRPPEQDRPCRMICLSATDTGVGIAPEHLDQIFDPFFSTKTLQEGAGLGLAAVHGIVQQHGGWIEVKSTRGKGTTFRLCLPEAQFALSVARNRTLNGRHDFSGVLRER